MQIPESVTAAAHMFHQAGIDWSEAAHAVERAYTRPSVVFRPTLSRDGCQWCMMLGEDLATGVAGFGASPEDAAKAFDEAWQCKG